MQDDQPTNDSTENGHSFTIKPRDFYLDLIVSAVEDGVGEFPVTLLINGALVTGKIIKTETYYQEVLGGAIARKLEGMVSSGELYTFDPCKLGSWSSNEEEMISKFLHLRDAEIYFGSHPGIPTEGVLMRIRVSSINGYFFTQVATDLMRQKK